MFPWEHCKSYNSRAISELPIWELERAGQTRRIFPSWYNLTPSHVGVNFCSTH
ncbi:MAG: hypothetical protein JWO91_2957 [Acidobacteriaceae bacterium]|jgi:hypothetical protein|nr:hypothetical protein [Acidobacteriaceae bacterium]